MKLADYKEIYYNGTPLTEIRWNGVTQWKKIVEQIQLSIRMSSRASDDNRQGFVFVKDDNYFYDIGDVETYSDSTVDVYLYASDGGVFDNPEADGTFFIEPHSGDADPFHLEESDISTNDGSFSFRLDSNYVDTDIDVGTYVYRISFRPNDEVHYSNASFTFEIIVEEPEIEEYYITCDACGCEYLNTDYNECPACGGNGPKDVRVTLSNSKFKRDIGYSDQYFYINLVGSISIPLASEYGKIKISSVGDDYFEINGEYSFLDNEGTFNLELECLASGVDRTHTYNVCFEPYEFPTGYNCIETQFTVEVHDITCPQCLDGNVINGYCSNPECDYEYTGSDDPDDPEETKEIREILVNDESLDEYEEISLNLGMIDGETSIFIEYPDVSKAAIKISDISDHLGYQETYYEENGAYISIAPSLGSTSGDIYVHIPETADYKASAVHIILGYTVV